MDATALVNLPRSRIVGLAKAHKIKANLSTKEIIRQLLVLFPNGVPSAPSILDATAAGLVEKVKGAFKPIARTGSRVASLAPDEAPVNANANQLTPTPVPAEVDGSPSRIRKSPTPGVERPPSLSYSDTANLLMLPTRKVQDNINTATEDQPRSPSMVPTEIGNDSPYARPNRPNEDQPGSLSMAPTLIVGNNSPYAHAGTTNLLRPPSPHINPIDSRGSFKSASLHSDDEEEDYDDDEDDDEDPGLSGHAANPEDVRRLIQDMATISARNKRYIHEATDMLQRAQALQEQAAHLRTTLVVEQTRRQRLADFFQSWRPTDPDWSYAAIWDGEITFAPVLCRFDDPELKGSLVMDQEVGTSDDEELVANWHQQDRDFKLRRTVRKYAKAQGRGVGVDEVSEAETLSDEEEFYAPFVLRPQNDDGTIPDEQCRVYPHMHESTGILLNHNPDIVVRRPVKRAREDNDGDADDEETERHSSRARTRFEHTSIVVPIPEMGDMTGTEFELARDRGLAKAMGKDIHDEENWGGLGSYRAEWRMRDD